MLTFEDLPVGATFDLGTFTLTAEEIVAFGRRFDPQPFHVDPDAAAHTPFGGLIASGWHTCSTMMRLYADAILADADSRGSPGMEEVRWLRPVRPDEPVRVVLTVVDARRSERTAGRGTVTIAWEGRDTDGELLVSMRGRGMFGTRSA